MNRVEFITHLKSGKPATAAVQEITGHKPEIVTIAELDSGNYYMRYGLMMTGGTMAALVILILYPSHISKDDMNRIRSGEPAGAVLVNMQRHQESIKSFSKAVRSTAVMTVRGESVGYVQEIFTESLFNA
jgi:hypothetical protein